MNEDAAPQLNVRYLVFTQDHDLREAVARFVQRYGVRPMEKPVVHGGVLWVGPVPTQGIDKQAERV